MQTTPSLVRNFEQNTADRIPSSCPLHSEDRARWIGYGLILTLALWGVIGLSVWLS